MKAESPMLTRQRDTTMRRKRAMINFEFPCCFFVVVLTYMFADFLFTSSRLMRDPFSKLHPKWDRNFELSSHYPGLNSLASFSCQISKPTNFQTQAVPLFLLGVRERIYLFPAAHNLGKRFWTSFFSCHV